MLKCPLNFIWIGLLLAASFARAECGPFSYEFTSVRYILKTSNGECPRDIKVVEPSLKGGFLFIVGDEELLVKNTLRFGDGRGFVSPLGETSILGTPFWWTSGIPQRLFSCSNDLSQFYYEYTPTNESPFGNRRNGVGVNIRCLYGRATLEREDLSNPKWEKRMGGYRLPF